MSRGNILVVLVLGCENHMMAVVFYRFIHQQRLPLTLQSGAQSHVEFVPRCQRVRKSLADSIVRHHYVIISYATWSRSRRVHTSTILHIGLSTFTENILDVAEGLGFNALFMRVKNVHAYSSSGYLTAARMTLRSFIFSIP